MGRHLSAIAVIAFLALPAPASSAAVHTHYGETAQAVATEMGCGDFHVADPGKDLHYGRCTLNGKTIYLITFDNKGAQDGWYAAAHRQVESDFYVAYGKGATGFTRTGSRNGAKAVAIALHAPVKNLLRDSRRPVMSNILSGMATPHSQPSRPSHASLLRNLDPRRAAVREAQEQVVRHPERHPGRLQPDSG